MRREPNLQTWNAVKTHITLMFQPVGRGKKARHQLDVAHQRANDTEASYTTYMRRLYLTIGAGVSEDERLYRYVKGLRDPIRENVFMREPLTLF